MKRVVTWLSITFLLVITASPAMAHFPWLATDKDGRVLYFFGETPADRTYKLPPSVAEAKTSVLSSHGEAAELSLTPIDQADFVGMQSSDSAPADATLISKVTYGIYHGTRLEYFTQHCPGKLPADRKAFKGLSKHVGLHAQLVDTDSGVDVRVIWQGKPLADAQVTLYCEEGHAEGKAKTDSDGVVSFTDKQVEDGLNGIVVGHTVAGESGSVGDKKYGSVSYYLTATFRDPDDFDVSTDKKKATKANQASKNQSGNVLLDSDRFPPIPHGVTSFGAAVNAHELYVYGGHMGEAHSYYAEAQGRTLWRLDLKNPKSWEAVDEGRGLQGLAMVTHGGKLYRIGGFEAKNLEGEEKDLWSQDSVACYDPKTKKWSQMPPLPEPRSSFDAAVLGDKIYVVGGWSMQGDGDSKWLKTAYELDLSSASSNWQPLAEPPFQRRALSVAAHDGKVYAIGGMQMKGGPSKRVDIFDPDTNTWSQGPELVGENMDGFGSSSFAIGGKLYASTYSGFLQQLSDDGKSWNKLADLESDRFFHRLLPLSSNQLLVVGGASMSSGKFEDLEVLTIK